MHSVEGALERKSYVNNAVLIFATQDFPVGRSNYAELGDLPGGIADNNV